MKEEKKELKCFMCNVVWLRKYHQLTKKEMAKIMGISVKSLSKIENGELPPKINVKVFFNIQDSFGITPAEQLSSLLKK